MTSTVKLISYSQASEDFEDLGLAVVRIDSILC